MKVNVGTSILKDSFSAGTEIGRNSLKGMKAPKIGFLFTSTKYRQDEVIKGIRKLYPDLKLVGCTSSNAILTQDGIITSEDGFGGMMVIEDNEMTVGISSSSRGEDPRLTGQKIAKEAMMDAGKKYAPVAFAMFASPREEEKYLKGIQDVIGNVPVFGGSAADDSLNNEWKVFSSDRVFKDGCAVAFFYTTKEIKNIFTGAYKETDTYGVITKVENERVIAEIDNEPALTKYSEWTGIPKEEMHGKAMLNASITSPLGIKTIQGELMAIRHPLIGNTDDESFTVGAKVVDKTAVILLNNDVDGLIEGAVASINEVKNNDFNPGGLLIMHDLGRSLLIDDRLDEDFVAIKNAAIDTPFIVVFSFGEYGQRDNSGATISNLSLSITGFSE